MLMQLEMIVRHLNGYGISVLPDELIYRWSCEANIDGLEDFWSIGVEKFAYYSSGVLVREGR